MKKSKTPGSSHDFDQSVQWSDGSVCRIELICVTDGQPRIFIDDGYGAHGDGNGRANIKRALTYTHDGHPVFFCRQPLKDWDLVDAVGKKRTIEAVNVGVITDKIKSLIDTNRLARGEVLAEAAGTMSVAGAPIDKAVAAALGAAGGAKHVKA
jgi:hypothetical protein